MARRFMILSLAAAVVSAGSCGTEPLRCTAALRAIHTDIDRQDSAFDTNPDGGSQTISPHLEAWLGGWGLLADYQRADADSGVTQIGNGVRRTTSEETKAELFLGHRLTAGRGELDLYAGVRNWRIRLDSSDQRFAQPPPPSTWSDSRSDYEAVLGARFHHPLGPLTGHLRADAGRSHATESWLLGIGLSLDLGDHLTLGAGVEWSDLDMPGGPALGSPVRDRRALAVLVGLAVRF